MCANLCGRVGLSTLARSAGSKKDDYICGYLTETLAQVLEQFVTDAHVGEFVPDAPIWVCWWTGEETAPPIVKKCISSIRENAGNHPVHLIDRENYQNYLQIPEHILSKVADGTMCVANFSDYLRFALLATYGGLWLDATIYCSRSIPEEYFLQPVFTCKGTLGDPSGYISRYRWTSFCFGGYKGNVMFRYMRDVFDAYWSICDKAIDYLLVDYLINMGEQRLPAIRWLLDVVKKNNLHRDDLQSAMNAAISAEEFENVIKADTVLYKLSWRESYSVLTCEGHESIYAYFLKNHI